MSSLGREYQFSPTVSRTQHQKQPSTSIQFIHIRVQTLLNHFKHTTEAETDHILQNTKKDLASLTLSKVELRGKKTSSRRSSKTKSSFKKLET